jgi:CubicO group peptidase (beta-lactamase class C family)
MDITRRQFAWGAAAGIGAASLLPFPAYALTPNLSAANIRRFLNHGRSIGVKAVVIANRDGVLFEDGAVSEPSRIASIRKSFVSALYGISVADKGIDLDQTIGSVGIDDYTSLTEMEKSATIRDLLKARSGVYLPSSAETPAMQAARPERGSHAPGTFWYYNNWDFNVLGEVYQRLTGEGLFTAIEHRLTKPLGFQHFDPMVHARLGYDSDYPRFPAYNLWMSASDLARFGQLYLRNGDWQGQQLIQPEWVRESTGHYSLTGRNGWRSGYGYMWWRTSSEGEADPAGLPVGSYSAAGNGGRYISIFPDHDLVVAIQPDEKPGQPPVKLYADPDGVTNLLRILFGAGPLAQHGGAMRHGTKLDAQSKKAVAG